MYGLHPTLAAALAAEHRTDLLNAADRRRRARQARARNRLRAEGRRVCLPLLRWLTQRPALP